ncbi:MAG: ferrochelatase [Actinomycetota bacterium]
MNDFDAILLTSFGGPEQNSDVKPFLKNVAAGRDIPLERLAQVEEQYALYGGASPINQQNRELIAALQVELNANGIHIPVYLGNRNWVPYIKDTLGDLYDDGKRNILALVTSAFGSYSGCRQYQEDLDNALAQINEHDLYVEKVRLYWNHPGFFEAMCDQLSSTLESIDIGKAGRVQLIFTAHSIPSAWEISSPYRSQLLEFSKSLSTVVAPDLAWDLVFQSRSGPPSVPWLEPDIIDHLDALKASGTDCVVITPIGFVSDHMEVMYDLDNQAISHAAKLGMESRRTPTVGTHPAFVRGLRQLIQEYLEARSPLVAFGEPWTCNPNCCPITQQRPPSRPEQ